MRHLTIALAVLALAACGDDDPVAPPPELFRLDATFVQNEAIFVEKTHLGDAYGAVRLVFTSTEETDTLPPANPDYLGEPIVEAWRYRIYNGDTLHAELTRGYYHSDDGALITVGNVYWLATDVTYNGTTDMVARVTWTDHKSLDTFRDVLLRRR